MLNIEPLRAGFRRPLRKKVSSRWPGQLVITSSKIKKIKHFLLVGEYSSWSDEGFLKKLKFDFLTELYAKQYDFR